ncbi:MAG: hypothetical protein Aurels2KO_33210 [Aureliella sp.]
MLLEGPGNPGKWRTFPLGDCHVCAVDLLAGKQPMTVARTSAAIRDTDLVSNTLANCTRIRDRRLAGSICQRLAIESIFS